MLQVCPELRNQSNCGKTLSTSHVYANIDFVKDCLVLLPFIYIYIIYILLFNQTICFLLFNHCFVAMASASSTEDDSNTAYFDNFTCIICLEVLQEPVQCVKNEHYFCKKCITKHLKRSQTCHLYQDNLTLETLRPIPRAVANILEQFQSARCRYVSRGCTSAVRREALLSHQEECGFAPVQCSHDGCEATVNRQDLVSHQQACEFRSVTCNDCHEAMRQREYRKHP
jgi:hypothetical protein